MKEKIRIELPDSIIIREIEGSDKEDIFRKMFSTGKEFDTKSSISFLDRDLDDEANKWLHTLSYGESYDLFFD